MSEGGGGEEKCPKVSHASHIFFEWETPSLSHRHIHSFSLFFGSFILTFLYKSKVFSLLARTLVISGMRKAYQFYFQFILT